MARRRSPNPFKKLYTAFIMIYLFAGDDADKKIANYQKFITLLPKETEVFKIARNNFDKVEIESFFSGSGLFFKTCAVVFSNILEREDERGFVFSKLNELADSLNTFVFIESKLLKSELDEFKEVKAQINYFELPKEKHEKYNNFILANDLGARDKKSLWLHYREAVDLGVGLEELVGVMFWKVKDMLVKGLYGKWQKEELQKVGARLSYLLPEARREGRDAEIAFEQFILEIF